jgi:hypothetical protein
MISHSRGILGRKGARSRRDHDGGRRGVRACDPTRRLRRLARAATSRSRCTRFSSSRKTAGSSSASRGRSSGASSSGC